MLSLSDQWAAAGRRRSGRPSSLSAKAMLAIYDGPGLDAGVFLVMVATLGLSWVMLKARTLGRVGPAPGILAGLVGLSYYPALFAPSTRIFLLEAAGPFYLVWVALAARSVLRLGAAAVSGRHARGWDVAQP